MRKYNVVLIILTLISVATVAALASLGNQSRMGLSEQNKQIPGVSESRWPIASFETPEPTDEIKRAKRLSKGKRYDRSLFGVKGAIKAPPVTAHMITLTDHWHENLPALPVAQSDVVIVGEVQGMEAYVSNDKTGVYSEFSVRVMEVLKGDENTPVASGHTIIMDRPGGRVQSPSGRVQLFRIAEMQMPNLGRQYVLFLKREEQDFYLLTGYELREGRIYPLDRGVEKFDSYEGTDQATFLESVRTEIARH